MCTSRKSSARGVNDPARCIAGEFAGWGQTLYTYMRDDNDNDNNNAREHEWERKFCNVRGRSWVARWRERPREDFLPVWVCARYNDDDQYSSGLKLVREQTKKCWDFFFLISRKFVEIRGLFHFFPWGSGFDFVKSRNLSTKSFQWV